MKRDRLALIDLGHPMIGKAAVAYDFNGSNLTPEEIAAFLNAVNKAACEAFNRLINDRTLARAEDIIKAASTPDPSAKGRKLDVLRLADGKRQTVLTWMARNALPLPESVVERERCKCGCGLIIPASPSSACQLSLAV